LLEDFIKTPIDFRKIDYILKNIIGYKGYGYGHLPNENQKIIANFYKTVKINYRLNELEKCRITNTIALLKIIQSNLKKTKLNSANIQFRYLDFKFLISKNMIGVCCVMSDNVFRPKILNKILKYLVYNDKLDNLYDMLEKYYLTSN